MNSILFVCRGNVGRSQMASALYNSLGKHSDSAGTNPKRVELSVGEIPKAKNAIAVMQELGLDIASNTRRKLTPEMVQRYDLVITMAEPEETPDFLAHSPNVQTWVVSDPADMDLDDTRKIRDQIYEKVKLLA